MAESITLYLHFPCFDGVISAVLASEYLKRRQGLTTTAFVPLTYAVRSTWLATKLEKPAAVVDFLYHPDAIFWADHHPTAFLTPEAEAQCRQRQSPDLLYDPRASSCAEVVWRKGYRLLREPRFREMVQWARRIDSARYSTPGDAVLGESPALNINTSLLQDASAEYCRFLIEELTTRSLADVAASPRVQRSYRKARAGILSGQKLFRKAARLEDDNIVVFDMGQKDSTRVSRYAPYLEYPQAKYSVGIVNTVDGPKITAMRNPWKPFRSVPLGQIFRSYGGGGHQRVASVLLKDASEAERMLGDILTDMRRAGGRSAPAQQMVTTS